MENASASGGHFQTGYKKSPRSAGIVNQFNRRQNNMRKILTRALLCLAVLLTAAAALKGLRVYVVMSSSMEPGIKTGSLIITDTMKKEPAPGRIITFYTGTNRVTHRVVRIEEDGTVITKGDGNPCEDPSPVKPDQIEGTVLFSVPAAGSVILMARRPSAFCLSFFIMMLIAVINRLKERKAE